MLSLSIIKSVTQRYETQIDVLIIPNILLPLRFTIVFICLLYVASMNLQHLLWKNVQPVYIRYEKVISQNFSLQQLLQRHWSGTGY